MARKVDPALLRKAVRSGTRALVQRVIEKLSPAQLAPVLIELSPHELRIVVDELLRERRLVDTLQELPEEIRAELVETFDVQTLARLLGRLELDDAARLALAIDESARTVVLDAIEPRSVGQKIARLLRYTPDSAGGRMLPHFVSVAPDATVGDGIRAIRQAAAATPLFYLYVVDDAGTLHGVASLSQLVRAPGDDTAVSDLMVRDVVSVGPDADQEEVARLVSRHNLLALPVVEAGALVGLVTVDDVIDVLEQEATEDMYNMAGLSEGDRVFSPPYRSLIKRLPWNALNLLTSMLAASVVAMFEKTIGQLVALAVFMPIVAGIGGNTGNQTLTVIIRGITLGELEFSSALRALAKEVVVGLSIGIVLGSAVALVAWMWKGNVMLGVVVAMAMVANLFIAALVGTAIPLTLKRLGLDPALGGSILVTMCTDVFGFLCFLGLATLFMSYLL
ncbi:MAG: magnesium transporter [Myxococcales bacterium]|nr:magnesium transporter [Myxococcales bacterium]